MRTNLQISSTNAHIRLPENHLGRDFIVADLHGYRALLDETLSNLSFDPQIDRLLSVGDLIDRGPDSPGCLALLDEPWFYCVRGNHEQLLIDSIRSQKDENWSRWLMNGGSWVLEYPDSDTEVWCRALEKLPYTMTIPCQGKLVGLCHAQYSAPSWQQRFKAKDRLLQELLWGRSQVKNNQTDNISDIDWIFCGHTIVPEVRTLGNTTFIERGTYQNNPLTVIDLQQWLKSR